MRFFGGGSHREEVINVPVEQIRVNPYQPRKLFNEEKLAELALSIGQMGLIQPITVRRIGNHYEIVAGERRFRAAKSAGLETIPALVKQYTDQEIAQASLIENIQREDLNPLEEAQAYDQLLQEFSLTQEELAQQVGKSQSTIANKRRLLKLPQEVQDSVMQGQLTERHARSLLRLDDEETQVEVARIIQEKGYTVRETLQYLEDLMNQNKDEQKKRRVFVPKDVRIFINTINGAIKTMRKAGIGAQLEQSETDDYREYVIRIPKE